MVVITSIVLVSNSKFGGIVQLQNLAYDVALSIRQAQVYGISVARFKGTGTFDAGFGVHFDMSSDNDKTYTLFADATVNGLYDCPTSSVSFQVSEACEWVQTTTMTGGNRITDLCVTPPGVSENCDGVEKVDVVFVRPEPDAWISTDGISCTPQQQGSCQAGMRIVLTSPRGDEMSVVVDANGQISVKR